MTSGTLWGSAIAAATAAVIGLGTLVGVGLSADADPPRPPVVTTPTAGPTTAAAPGASAGSTAARAAPGRAETAGPGRAAAVGQIVTSDSASLAVQTRRGVRLSVTTTPRTIVWRAGHRIAVPDLRPGETVFIFGRVNRVEETVAARAIVVRPASRPRTRPL